MKLDWLRGRFEEFHQRTVDKPGLLKSGYYSDIYDLIDFKSPIFKFAVTPYLMYFVCCQVFFMWYMPKYLDPKTGSECSNAVGILLGLMMLALMAYQLVFEYV